MEEHRLLLWVPIHNDEDERKAGLTLLALKPRSYQVHDLDHAVGVQQKLCFGQPVGAGVGAAATMRPRDANSTKPFGSYPFYLRPFYWRQRRKNGQVLQAALLWGRAPKLFTGVAILYGMIDRRSSPINSTLRSLETVRVSQINDCPFCVDINSATLLKRGVGIEKLEPLHAWRQSALFDPREKLVLDYVEAMTRSDLKVDDGMIERLRSHFTDDAIVELTVLIAFQNMSSKFNSALGVPSQGFCKLPRDAATSQDARNDRVSGAS